MRKQIIHGIVKTINVNVGDTIEVPLYLGESVDINNIYLSSNMPENAKEEVDSYIKTSINEDETKLMIQITGKPTVANPTCVTSKLKYRLRYYIPSKDSTASTTSSIELYFYPEAKNNHDLDIPEYSGSCRERINVRCKRSGCNYSETVKCKPSYDHTLKQIITEPTCSSEGQAECSECNFRYDLPKKAHTYTSTQLRCTVCNGGLNEDYHYSNSNPTNSAEIAVAMIEDLKLKNYLSPAYTDTTHEKWIENAAKQIQEGYKNSGENYKYYDKGEQKNLLYYMVYEYIWDILDYQYAISASRCDAYEVLNLMGKDTNGDGIIDQHLANCEGYTVAARDLAWKLGIECYFVNTRSHALLLSKLDGEWYVVNVTPSIVLIIPIEEYDNKTKNPTYYNTPLLQVYVPHSTFLNNSTYPIAGYDVETKKMYEAEMDYIDNDIKMIRTDKLTFTGWKGANLSGDGYERNKSTGNIEVRQRYYYYGAYVSGPHTVEGKAYNFNDNGEVVTKIYEAPKLDLKSSYTITPTNYMIKIPVSNYSTYTEPIKTDEHVSVSADKKYIIYNAQSMITSSGNKFTGYIYSGLGNYISLAELNINIDKSTSTEHTHISVSANNAVAPTCTKAGKESDTKCKICGKKMTTGKTIPATGHSYKLTKATTSKDGYKKCSKCGNKSNIIYYPKTITLSTTTYSYNGKSRKPSVVVKGSNGKTISSSNYTVTYASGRKNTGKYKVTIAFKGNYTGTVTKYFYIVPKKVTGLKASKQTTSTITLSWSKATGASGYQLQKYNSSKKKWETVLTANKTSYKISKLKSGTSYKYRVRAYKTIGKDKKYGDYITITTATKTSTPKISKITTGSKKANLTWSKVSGASGYEIVMSTKKNKGFSKIKTVTNSKTIKYSKTKLKKGKKYYFKIRTYKTVNSKKIYSSYSKVKAIKIK